MRIEPLYRLHFVYTHSWEAHLGTSGLSGALIGEEQHFFFASGRCDGRVSGRFRASSAPHRRVDGTFTLAYQGVIETEDGAAILVEYHGYGHAYPSGQRRLVLTGTHLSDHENYSWLNNVIAVGTGDVRWEVPRQPEDPNAGAELIIEVSEVIWEPLPD